METSLGHLCSHWVVMEEAWEAFCTCFLLKSQEESVNDFGGQVVARVFAYQSPHYSLMRLVEEALFL